ncbi:MAG: hypothetical protein M3Y41_13195 [Pseudomonadota bacterium]|nr:hypothetical protein [Pseudomonadota bacterium]
MSGSTSIDFAGNNEQPIPGPGGQDWGIATDGRVTIAGVEDPHTANIVELANVSGVMWQENKSGNWYSETQNNDSWSGPTRHAPFVGVAGTGAILLGGSSFNDINDDTAKSMYWANGTASHPTLMAFSYDDNSTLTVSGSDALAQFAETANQTVVDHGTGTGIVLTNALAGPMNILDFQNDPFGHVVFSYLSTAALSPGGIRSVAGLYAALAPDGHGGTKLGPVDFVGDAHIGAGQLMIGGGH